MLSTTFRRIVIALVVAGALALVVTVAATRSRDEGPAVAAQTPAAGTEGLPTDPQVRESLRRQMLEMQEASMAREPRPKVRLPEDQRQPWIDAWNRMRECALRHGYDGVEPVPPSYGDGQSPMPRMNMSRPHAQEGLGACPFDTSGLDKDKVWAAVRAAQVGQ